MKKILCILLSLLLVLLNGCSSDTGNIRFGAAGVGGMYYTFANSFTGILSKENENYSYEVKPQVPPLISDCCPITISI